MNVIFKILIFDRYPVFGSGIKLILERENDLFVPKVLKNSKDLITQIKSLSPDLLLITSIHASDGGIPQIRKVKMQCPGLIVFVIAGEDATFQIDEFLKLDVEGIVRCSLDPEKLIEAIHLVLKGKRFYSEEPWRETYLRENFHLQNMNRLNKPDSILTRREIEILGRIARGLTHKQISDQLFISPRTVETYRDKILAKLNLRNTADIIRYAYLHQAL